ncbi:hypothetical protein C479_09258 [Halovivax asiaticus JCM 14624]|uniref:Uncharacterized protein n=1 Tax=Halovivax asiaticus JCM 14624 TaxID=1227490 RepID=M0BKJ6_9EURY|nr:hypothetical protein [Halovivax asiaticus]ELZ10987.1 hypothetical protein C479_09258 [Halovivax asiaticus JCM 14624]
MTNTEIDTTDWTAEEFESALADLIQTAKRSNVQTPRALDVTDEADGIEWMVEITRLDRRR